MCRKIFANSKERHIYSIYFHGEISTKLINTSSSILFVGCISMTDEKHKEHKATSNEDNENLNIDFSSIKKIFSNKKVNKILLTTLLIIIPLILTIFIRLQPWYLPATDVWAENAVDNYYRNNIVQQINTQYPNLASQQKDTLINNQFEEFKKTNKDQMDQQVKSTSEYFKAGFRYEENNNTYTFLGDLDSYTYLRGARNIEETGTICDVIIEGKCIDNHMVAPLGVETGAGMHNYGIVYLHSILYFFNPKVNLMQSAFLLPTLLAVIAAIAAFFIGRRLMNNTAGFFAAMFVALSPLFITRTLGSDTDIWNVMFPLLIIWIFLEAFESKEIWKKISLTALVGFFTGAFSFAWGGWWYVFDFILAGLIAYMLFELIKNYLTHKKLTKEVFQELKFTGMIFGIFFISTLIFVSLFTSFNGFKAAVTSPLDMLGTLKIAAHSNLWPNVYTTVAELNEASISSIVGQVSFGINVLFSLALLGTIFTMIKKKPDFKEYMLILVSAVVFIFLISSTALNMNPYTYLIILMIPIAVALLMRLKEKESEVDIKPALILTIWFVGMIFASTKGVRFILLLIPAFSIALGVALGYIYQCLSRFAHLEFKLNKNLTKIIVFGLLCLILITPINYGLSAGKNFVPSITKGWYDSLIKINQESQPDAIINSWWDFGHWFKYFADRRVTLDGASQNHPNAHWLGKILQTNSEKESVAILRMLDCGSNNAFEEINKKYQDTEKSQNIVSEIILMEKEDAKTHLLSLEYTDEETEKILTLTHCTPPEDYFITSEDMVGKAGVWAHFGLWDFDRAFIINEVKPKNVDEGTNILKERFNYSDEEASKIYYEVQGLLTDREMNNWISPWPGYSTGQISECINKDDIVVCVINLGMGNNGQANIVMEQVIINMTNPSDSQTLIGFYNANNQKVGETISALKEIIIAGEKMEKYEVNNGSIDLSLLLNAQPKIVMENNQTTVKINYQGLVADPLLIESTFTKLFFLDGKYMDHFEKFSDITDIAGTRIIVWKVNWD